MPIPPQYKYKNFNNINLQLHASSSVSNPYTFNINNNCNFSATIEAQSTLPESETALTTMVASRKNVTYVADVEIPSGVQVVKFAIGTIDPSGEILVGNLSSSDISWNDSNYAWTYDENTNEQYTYVGVTPNKTYTFTYEGYNVYYALYYSSTINELEPEFTDY